jgi:type IV secretion/conjugal transfer VirB4 family ATPase
MIRLDRIFRDYREAGALNELIAPWGFVDDSTFVTKAGDLGVVFAMKGLDATALTHEQRLRITHQFESALRLLNERVHVYQYFVKEQAKPFVPASARRAVAAESFQRRSVYLNGRRSQLFSVSQYLVLLLEHDRMSAVHRSCRQLWASPLEAIRERLSVRATVTLLESQLDKSVRTLDQLATSVAVQLADCSLRRLHKQEVFAFLRRLVNFDAHVVDASHLRYDTHLDYFVADSPVECHRDHLRIGSRSVTALSMKEPPSRTHAHMLADLLRVPCEFVACLEWQRLPNEKIRRDIHARRRHFFNKRVSLVNYAAPDTQPDEMLVDDSAGATVNQLGDALIEIETNGHFFGSASLAVILHGSDRELVRSGAAEALKTLAAHDGVFVEESYNLLNAWLAVMPGNYAHNLRRLAVLETNLADLSFAFAQDCGDETCRHLGRPALAAFETPEQTPYFFNLHVEDVGHAVVLGSTGSGKSFLLNFLITQLQQHDPRLVVLDLGHSYRKLATLLEGAYVELGVRRQAVTINPFDLDRPSAEQLHFLHSFTRVLIEGEEGYKLSHLEDREIYEAIENLFVLERPQRRLFTLASLVPRALGGRLHKWIEGGRYAGVFDNEADTLSLDRLQVFDFEAMRSYPAVLEPLLFYVLHRVSTSVQSESDADLKVCVLDEAWRLIQHPAVRGYVQEALKTWRKKNGVMLLATQSLDDFASADLLRTVIESCPTRLLLANPSMNVEQYRELLQLNDMELSVLANLVPKRQILLKRPSSSRVLELNVDPKSYWIYTNTPIDNERVASVFRELGFAAGLDRLAATA